MLKNAIVVGLPRSGTSMTAFIFAQKGYFTAESGTGELREGDLHNPSGYLEAQTLINFNAEVFSAVGFPHDNTWLYAPIADDQARSIHAVEPAAAHRQFVDRYDQNSPWLWKDPRLCYTLDYWWPLLNADHTGVLLLKRSPEEIYQSFIRLKWRKSSAASKHDVYTRINEHIAAAERAIARYQIPHIVIDYRDYKANPVAVAQRIGQFFDIDMHASDLNYAPQLNHSNLRGRLATTIDLRANRIPSAWLKRLKQLVPSWLQRAIYPERFR